MFFGGGEGEERVQGSGFRMGGTEGVAMGRGGEMCIRDRGGGAKRSLKHTGARPVDGAGGGSGEGTEGAAMVFPGTWSLKPRWTGGLFLCPWCCGKNALSNHAYAWGGHVR